MVKVREYEKLKLCIMKKVITKKRYGNINIKPCRFSDKGD